MGEQSKEEVPIRKSSMQVIVDLFKRDVDVEALRENLKLTVEQRLEKHRAMAEFLEQMRHSKQPASDRESL